MSPKFSVPEKFGIPETEGDRPTKQSGNTLSFVWVLYQYCDLPSDPLIANAIIKGDRPAKPNDAARIEFND